jgi:hypothetical protein
MEAPGGGEAFLVDRLTYQGLCLISGNTLITRQNKPDRYKRHIPSRKVLLPSRNTGQIQN